MFMKDGLLFPADIHSNLNKTPEIVWLLQTLLALKRKLQGL